jgi:hypothetical protein
MADTSDGISTPRPRNAPLEGWEVQGEADPATTPEMQEAALDAWAAEYAGLLFRVLRRACGWGGSES